MRILLAALLAGLAGLASLAYAQSSAEPIRVRMMADSYSIPPPEATNPSSVARRAVFAEFGRQNPDILLSNAGGLILPNTEAQMMMAFAGGTAPDVFYINIRQYFSYVEQGFARPLDDLLARDPGAFASVHPRILEVLKSYDGKVYAAPFMQVAQALYYRKDFLERAGLDPAKPPRTWDEFIEYGRRITELGGGIKGFVFPRGAGGASFWWTNFVVQAGGRVLEPGENGWSRAVVASPAGVKALDLFRRLTQETWIGKDGRRHGPIADMTTQWGDSIRTGKVGMWFGYSNDVVVNQSDLPLQLTGMAAMPAGPAGSTGEINSGMWAISAAVKDPRKLDACWRFIKFFMSDAAARITTQQFVEQGMSGLVNPANLKKFGYPDLAARSDPQYLKANEELFDRGQPEPYGRNSAQVYVVLDNALERAALEPDTPSKVILEQVQFEMNRQMLGYVDPQTMAARRGWAAGIAIAIGLIAAWFLWRLVLKAKEALLRAEDSLIPGTKRSTVLLTMSACILPAALSVLVWAYYPLLQGLVIAFQEYRVMQPSQWVGLDNFISVFTQPLFYRSLLNSLLYVALSLGLGFFAPILLALALNEIQRFGTLLRVLYYLPAMTSGLVIAFMWRWFYDKSPDGLLNTIVSGPIGLINAATGASLPLSYDWLGDARLAMLAVVLPGIWAGAGPGSLLYLAALKNIPDERYEAADIDGASWWRKITAITLPSLTPLLLINLLGAFIGGFKAMENIFVMTGGGPLYATHTVGMEIWMNAFMFLKFGYATAAAWVLGAILIGFTMIQLRQFVNMKFTTSRTGSS